MKETTGNSWQVEGNGNVRKHCGIRLEIRVSQVSKGVVRHLFLAIVVSESLWILILACIPQNSCVLLALVKD